MSLKKMSLLISRVRVDFGNDVFIDQPDAINQVLFSGESIDELKTELTAWVKMKEGEIVEIDDELENVVIDTKDLTLWLTIEK